MPHTLHKTERLCRKKLIGEMFSGKARSFTCFPLRVVYLPVAEQPCSATILVSVSKRRFKRAVKRNRIKRQVREAYRLNKQLLLQPLDREKKQVAIAFIYLSDKQVPTSHINDQMKRILQRLAESLQTNPSDNHPTEVQIEP